MSETPLYILTPDEAATLIAAREVCKAVDQRCRSAAWNAPNQRRAFDLGKVSEAADLAEHVCFNVLNCASSYADCRVSANAIDRANGRVPRFPDPVVSPGPDAAPEVDGAPAALKVVE